MVHSGHPRAQAIAAALNTARRSGAKFQEGGDVDDTSDAAAQAAQRTRLSVLGRREGPATNVLENYIPHAVTTAARLASFPGRYMQSYQPGQTLEDNPEATKWAPEMAMQMLRTGAPAAKTGTVGIGGGKIGGPALDELEALIKQTLDKPGREQLNQELSGVGSKPISQIGMEKYKSELEQGSYATAPKPPPEMMGSATETPSGMEQVPAPVRSDLLPSAPPNRVLSDLKNPDAADYRRRFNIDAYHGTASKHPFEEFNLPPDEIGVHIGTARAAHDIKGIGKWSPPGARIYPVKAMIHSPLELPDLGNWSPMEMKPALIANGFPSNEVNFASSMGSEGLRAYLKSKGYDGIKYKNTVEHPGSTSYIALDPSQIRSPWAKFNPLNKQSRNIGSAVAGAGVTGYFTGRENKTQEEGMKRGGTPHRAFGGSNFAPWFERSAARGMTHQGMLSSSVPGRTDRLPITVGGGSYVVPADHLSAIGQGNSQAGAKILDAMFHGTPFGGKPMRASGGVHMPRLGQLKMPKMRADGGGAGHNVPIIAAGGEYVIPPEAIKAKFGDIDRGHKILDKWVVKTRKHHIKTLRGLPPPKKD